MNWRAPAAAAVPASGEVSIATLAQDYAFGKDGVKAFKDAIKKAKVVHEEYLPTTTTDFTAGAHFGERWLVLAQAYGGAADGGSRWLSAETSVVRHLGTWSVQAGWRQTVAGRETPVSGGPVLSVWKRF